MYASLSFGNRPWKRIRSPPQRGRTAESQSGPRYPLPAPLNRSRPALAGGLHWLAGSDMPSSRRIADAGFKDSAVKKLACLPRIRPSSGAAMVATWVGPAGPLQGLHRGSPPSESGGSRNARFYWVFRTSRSGGGEGGIRTPDRLAPMPHFECGAFDHSATSPGAMTGDLLPPRSGRVLGEDG